MKSRSHQWILWLAGGACVCVGLVGTVPAQAQYGGRSTGGNFTAPRDPQAATRNYRAPQAQTAQEPASNDPYDPQVWAGGRRGWSGGAPSSRGPQPGARSSGSPVKQAAFNSQGYAMGEEVMPMEMGYGPGPEEMWDGHPPGSGHGGGCNCGGGGGPGMHMPGGGGGDCLSCGGGGDCNSCGSGGSCNSCPSGVQGCCVPCIFPNYIEVFAGPQGFKGPRDFGVNGDFGFHEGFNAAGPLGIIPGCDLSYQIGFQLMQSNLSGTVFDEEYRRQHFLTAGLFHREDCGLNYGAVWDWQHDEYYDTLDMNQVRGEISFRNPHGGEIGFWGAVAVNDDNGDGFNNGVQPLDDANWEVNDQFNFFYRWNLECGGDFRVWGGFSGSKDGVIGSDFHLPLNDCWSVHGGFNYLIPSEGNQDVGLDALGAINETWNITLSLAYTFGRKAKSQGCGTWRPMFDVADNGTFFVQPQDGQE